MGNRCCSSKPCCHTYGTGRRLRITTGYWNCRGIGAPARMMCTYAGVDAWEDIKYDVLQFPNGSWAAPTWEQNHKPPLAEKNALVDLPYVVNHTTGAVITQPSAVGLYLGRLLNLNGWDPEQQAGNEQLLSHDVHMWSDLCQLVYPFHGNHDEAMFRESMGAYFDALMPFHYAKLEKWMQKFRRPFFCSHYPMTADFHIWEILDQHEELAKRYNLPSPLYDFKNLTLFHHRFRALRQLVRYFSEGGDGNMPMHNKMAYFK
eukprot:NODE_15847_length_1027_cov_3.472222.p1 GENE.NODE_15847_length_1027_cov_3.472222~~NODE_15847_length_1027_cov_3.472222.p1  ORF type:complete len:260 (-),score=64.90 NODE_15847_length_1027_cov_3.472222:72-851(-)